MTKLGDFKNNTSPLGFYEAEIHLMRKEILRAKRMTENALMQIGFAEDRLEHFEKCINDLRYAHIFIGKLDEPTMAYCDNKECSQQIFPLAEGIHCPRCKAKGRKA